MRRGARQLDGRVRWALVAASLISIAATLLLSRDFWFYGDELDWLTYGRDFEPRTLLTPHGSHLIAIPRVIYEGFPRVFGVDYLPFRLLTAVAVVAIALLFNQLARERVGSLPALAATCVLLFFGSAADVVLSPLGIPFLLAIAFGLASLLVLERTPKGWQPLACLLLVLSGLSHTFGVIFAGAALVYLLLTPSMRTGVWAAAIPIVGWVVWWRWAEQFGQSIAEGGNVLGAPVFALEAFGAAIQAATGFGPYFGAGPGIVADVFAVAFLLVAIAAIALLAFRIVAGLATPWLWSYLTLGFGFWLAIGLAEAEERQPDSPRYLLFGAVVVFLIAAEALRDTRVPERLRRAGVALGVTLAVIAIAGNAARLIALTPGIEEAGADTRAQITSARIAAGLADGDASIGALGAPASPYAAAPIGRILSFESQHGELGHSIEGLEAQPERDRAGADYVLAQLEGVTMRLVDPGEIDAELICRTPPTPADGYTRIRLVEGFNFLQAAGDRSRGEVPVELGRFADNASVEVGSLPSGERAVAGVIGVRPDATQKPWFATVPGAARVCRPARAAPDPGARRPSSR